MGALQKRRGIKLERCRQEWRSGLLGSCLALLNNDDNGSLWECIEVIYQCLLSALGSLNKVL